MQFASTRNDKDIKSFQEAIFQGLAPDGGLYHPTTTPDLSALFSRFNASTAFTELAAEVMGALFPGEIPADAAYALAEKAFPFTPALTQVDETLHILELFHGPSCAFKDFGASFLATAMEYFLKQGAQKAVILTATSGDTGSAVAQAFYNKANIEVVILYPSGRVSPLQEKQLTSLGGNISALEVEGSFDDCQRMVKKAFVDPALSSSIKMFSANSINLGRLLPQSLYYIWAWAHMKETGRDIIFSVPSGNFGNLTAGVLAYTWGLPVKRFIAATNINDVVPAYLKTAVFTPRPSRHTLSNAMDVGNPSNFERLMTIFDSNKDNMNALVHGDVVTDAETQTVIKRCLNEKKLCIDPHSAVGLLAAERFREELPAGTRLPNFICLSTAHPGKFGEVVEAATGTRPPIPERLAKIQDKEKTSTVIGNTTEALSQFLKQHYC